VVADLGVVVAADLRGLPAARAETRSAPQADLRGQAAPAALRREQQAGHTGGVLARLAATAVQGQRG